MKRIALFAGLALAVGLVAIPGCHKTAPPAWALTAPERTVGDVIASANASVFKYEKDVAAGESYTENTKLKAVMRDIQKSLAIAQPAYSVWSVAL